MRHTFLQDCAFVTLELFGYDVLPTEVHVWCKFFKLISKFWV